MRETQRVPTDGILLERVGVLAYATQGNVTAHRAIMRVFADAKVRYVLQLRPDDVLAELAQSTYAYDLPDAGVQPLLDQLVEWGNLERSQDTRRATTLEEFRRRHSVYAISPAGEAAERAVRDLENLSAGSLRAVMLAPILDNLRTLAAQLATGAPDPAVLYRALFDLLAQFDALADNASAFMGSLHRAIEAGEVHAEAFLAYKQAVVAYIQQFLAELTRLAPSIAQAIADVEAHGRDRLIAIAAAAEDAPVLGDDAPDPADALGRRWSGVVGWFVGARPTVDLLRAAATDAINRILALLAHLNERRFRRVNRAADLLRLAAWFSTLPNDSSAHRLFNGAFGLASCRHVGVLHTDPEMIPSGTSWWDAPPVPVAPQLRTIGMETRRGATTRVEDNSAVKAELRERLRLERERVERATTSLVARGTFLVSELGWLEDAELDLFLALIDRALAAGGSSRSRDGRIAVTLEAPEDGMLAAVPTPRGALTMRDFAVTIAWARALAGVHA